MIFGIIKKVKKDIHDWTGLVEIKIKPKSFTRHKSEFIYKYFVGHYTEKEGLMRDDIFRIPSEDSIILTSLTFVNNLYSIKSSGEKSVIVFCK